MLGDFTVSNNELTYWLAFQARDGMRNIVIQGPFTYDEAVKQREITKSFSVPGELYSVPFTAKCKKEAEQRAPSFL